MFKGKGKTLFILFFMLGLLLTLEGKLLSKGVKYVAVENLQETITAVEKEKAEVEQLRSALQTENEKLALYGDAANVDQHALVQTLEARKVELEEVINYTDVEGPGVIVIVDDADRDLFQGEDGNNVLVHDADVGIIVNDLRLAGAEAISINGERVIFNNTRIVCVGPTVKVNGEQMGAPFIIKAIGNRKHLEAAINAPGNYAEILESYGLFVEVNTSISVKIDRYEGDIHNEYLKYYEAGEEK
ncbi:MAG: DUF881 domain-containing protein [Clostridia bacterium]|nr:DUF881 domain-containing protein [Clostridia bacterium]